MTIDRLTRIAYGLFGILYVIIGVGSLLLPAGWLPAGLAGEFLDVETPSPFFKHLLQEFGTVVLALGFVFLWYARRKEQSRAFHWIMTFYFLLNALIHWVGADGIIGSWSRGIVNTIPFVVMLILGLLHSRQTGKPERQETTRAA